MTPVKTSLTVFLKHEKTKASLTEYLAHKMLGHYRHSKKALVVSTESGTFSHHMSVNHLTNTHEEGDTLIILHAIDIHTNGSIVHLLSPDPDVFVLALKYFPSIGSETCIYLGTGQKQRLVPLKPIYDIIGSDMTTALPGFHSFTGCDTTGRFVEKGKLTCWNTLQKAKTHVVKVFKLLGTTEMPFEDIVHCLEEYVCQLYSSTTTAKNVGKLRWQLFKRSQSEAEKLPPTIGALRHHILRAQCTLPGHGMASCW